MKLTATQQLLKKHSNRIWDSFKRMQGVYVNKESDISYKLVVTEYKDIPYFPESSVEEEPMISITLHELVNNEPTRVIPILSSRKAMDSVYEIEQVEQAYEDILYYTGASPKYYATFIGIKAIFQVVEEDRKAGL